MDVILHFANIYDRRRLISMLLHQTEYRWNILPGASTKLFLQIQNITPTTYVLMMYEIVCMVSWIISSSMA